MKKSFGERVRRLTTMKNVMIGLMIGTLTGATIMLLFAPQSGRQTRGKIYQRNTQVLDHKQMD
jgi:gas vesicle protein